MKWYIKKIQKKLLNLKRKRSLSGSSSDDPSFSSGLSSESSESQTVYKNCKPSGSTTPISVLVNSNEINWIDNYITNAFQMMDHDRDGKINKDELQILLSKICVNSGKSLTEYEVKLMLNDVDENGDGYVSLDDLNFFSEAFESPTCDEELRETFNFFDADHDGKISAMELYNVFQTIVGDGGCSLDECERMINGVDRNGDGLVCFEDFSIMMDLQVKR